MNPRRVGRGLLDYVWAAADLLDAELLLDLQLAACDTKGLDIAARIGDEFRFPGGSTDM